MRRGKPIPPELVTRLRAHISRYGPCYIGAQTGHDQTWVSKVAHGKITTCPDDRLERIVNRMDQLHRQFQNDRLVRQANQVA
jgi:hypothetical protein